MNRRAAQPIPMVARGMRAAPPVLIPAQLTRQNAPARVAQTVLFGLLSASAHAGVVAAFVLLAHPSPTLAAARDPIDIAVEPALGLPHGTSEGRGLGSHLQGPSPAPGHHAASHKAHAPPSDPDAIATAPSPVPSTPAGSVQPPANPDPPTPPAPGPEQITPDAPPGDPATPAGSANVAPAPGSPDGSGSGTGTAPARARMTARYAGVLAGWFGARFNVRGLGLEPDELRQLSVRVSISITDDRRVTSFSLAGSSGNAAYDAEVRRTLSGIQASGVSLPEPPDGSTPPASFSVRFRPMVIH